MSATPARVAALDVLRAVRAGELADRALLSSLDGLEPGDRPWTQELVYGTLRLRGRLDYLLAQRVTRPLDSLDADVLDTLRLGAYQLLEMRSVPAYAAVSQSVELVRGASGEGAAKLVNAVLQSLRRQGPDSSFPPFEQDPVAHLATAGSHPRWLVERWVERFGADDARALVDLNNRRPELYLRPIGLTVENARARLEQVGIAVEDVPDIPHVLHLATDERGALQRALSSIPAVVQDPAAALVADVATPDRPGLRIADVAAAPGGKTLALAGGSRDTSPQYVFAGDVSQDRVRRVRENALRIGPLPLGIAVADARRPPLRDNGHDVVLLDAPCTGTGTFRRHPDGRWRITPRDLSALVRLQLEMLRGAAPLVRTGGTLVYATCSLEPEENERQVEAFLADRPDFTLELAAGVHPRFVDRQGFLRVLPQTSGFDGAFAARLRRR